MPRSDGVRGQADRQGRVPADRPASAPKQEPEGGPDAWLAIEPSVLDALDGVRPRGRRIPTGDGSRGWDYCRLWLEARTVRRDGRQRRVDRKLVVSVPLTQQGAVFLDGQEHAFLLLSTLTISEFAADDRGRNGFLTPAELIAVITAEGTGAPSAVVALASPSDTPPPDAVGYYSDGAKHAAAVTLSTLGKRLFLEINGDVLHTNITQYTRGLD
jgi:hypothetical protein